MCKRLHEQVFDMAESNVGHGIPRRTVTDARVTVTSADVISCL